MPPRVFGRYGMGWAGDEEIKLASTKETFKYLSGYLNKSFANTYVQAFMWFWRLRQWSCNFPCPTDLETNSNPKMRIFGIGVCVIRDLEPVFYSIGSFTVELKSFLMRNGLYVAAYKWTLRNIPFEQSYEMVAKMLKYNWLSYRHEGLCV